MSPRVQKSVPFREAPQWSTPISELRLTIEGTALAPVVDELRRELAAAGITRVRPEFYLSTEWGVPFGSVAIAIPFYLASAELTALHDEQVGHVEGLGPADVLRYLRHETGHVLNYAYRLYEEEEWIQRFGSIALPYAEDYRPHPFSKGFVRHLPGWYAQKHPDEDWAETFAVWLTPGSDWRRDYGDWPVARGKLEYCERVMRGLADREPAEHSRERDEDVAQLHYSLEHFYRASYLPEASLPHWLDGALVSMFDGRASSPDGAPRKPASLLFERLERDLMASVHRWTGHFPERTRSLVRRLGARSDVLGLHYLAEREVSTTVDITTLVGALAMTYVHGGDYAGGDHSP